MGIVAQTWSLKPQHRLVVQPHHRALFHVDGRHGFCAVVGIEMGIIHLVFRRARLIVACRPLGHLGWGDVPLRQPHTRTLR